jgi:hypothetical protein
MCTVSKIKNLNQYESIQRLTASYSVLQRLTASYRINTASSNAVFNVIGLTVLPSDLMSSYYDHIYKIEELNYKEGW